MKSFLGVVSLVLACSFSTQAGQLNCSSEASQGLKEIVTVIKMKNKVPAELMQQMNQQLSKAANCEEIDRINLGIIGYVISSMP